MYVEYVTTVHQVCIRHAQSGQPDHRLPVRRTRQHHVELFQRKFDWAFVRMAQNIGVKPGLDKALVD